jgi:TonB family protein
MGIQVSIKKMMILSALFHAGLSVLLLSIALSRSTHPFSPQVYEVDLVTFPSSPAQPTEVKEVPAAPPPPPVQKPLLQEKKPPKVEMKKPPAQPPKPIRPAAVTKPSDAVAAIPSPAAKIEAGIEAPDFKYPYYLHLIQQKIEMHWSPPPIESGSELKETVVGFILSSTGKIGDPAIEKSSGNAFFDQAALRAIYQANPLPPFPQGIRDPSLKVHFSFSLMKKS